MTAGGGLDYNLPWFNGHLGLRLFQADYEYLHINFGPQNFTGGRMNANTARLSTGLVFKFGNIVLLLRWPMRARRARNCLSWRANYDYRNGDEPEPEENGDV